MIPDTSRGMRYQGLDHLRALAILLVFFFHYQIISHGNPEWLPEAVRLGWTGVDLFFVLSGFLISSQLFIQIKETGSVNWKSFIIKRIFRIIPPYLFILAVYFLVPAFREKEALPPLWRFLTFTQNIGLDISKTGTFSHAWSLCVEEHFYFFLPLILLLLIRLGQFQRGMMLLILFLIGTIGIRYILFHQLYEPHQLEQDGWKYWYRLIYYPTWCRLDGLLTGVGIAAINVFRPETWKKITSFGNGWLLTGLGLLTYAWFLCEDEMNEMASVWGFTIVAIGHGSLVMAALSPETLLSRYSSSLTSFIARVSYDIYLSHKGIIHLTLVYLGMYTVNQNLLLIAGFIFSIFAGQILYQFIDTPSAKMKERWLQRK